MKRTIEFYAENKYGIRREYIKEPNTATFIRYLTNQKTIDGNMRNAISGLLMRVAGVEVEWKETLK
jgi:hypothetical protein